MVKALHLLIYLSVFASTCCAKGKDWRELVVPSFEADHANQFVFGEDPLASSFKEVTKALQIVQSRNNITEDYVKSLPLLPQVTTFNMSMSDGAQIWTRVVNPWPHNRKKAAILVRSPYGSMATQNLALIFLVLNGHAAVMQETRGTGSSGGVFDMWRGSGQDAKDTIQWIMKQSWNNGEVYSQGASADGIDAFEETLAAPKQLHGEWLIWTTGNGHHFAYPGGAYRKDLMLGYFGSALGHTTRGASTKFVLPATQQNEANGPWWYNLTDCANMSDPTVVPGCRYQLVTWPVLINAGWWDLFSHTNLDAWMGLRAVGDPKYRDDHALIVGPLGHNIVGGHETGVLETARLIAAEVDALVVGGELASEFWRWAKCSNEWAIDNKCSCKGRVRFGSSLLNKWSPAKLVDGSVKCDTKNFPDPAPGVAKECQCQEANGPLRKRIGRVNFFIMGSFGAEIPIGAGNYWTSLDDFPNPKPTEWYIGASGSLSEFQSKETGSTSYQYDPKHPTPAVGGCNLPAIGHIKYGGTANQVGRENRSDVIHFDSTALPADLAVVGHLAATVFVSSTAKDTDFYVTVDDLNPDGSKSMLVRYGIQRMRWRESEYVKSAPMTPGTVYKADINMGYTAYIFPKGHRIRVSVSSANDPYYVPTTNTGANDMTTKVAPVVATNTVHFAADKPSRISLPVVSLTDIPKNPHFTAIGPFSTAANEILLV